MVGTANKISGLFKSNGRNVLSNISVSSEKLGVCIASTIVGTYANRYYAEYFFKPLKEFYGFDKNAHEVQVRQLLLANYNINETIFDKPPSSVYIRSLHGQRIEMDEATRMSIDSPAVEICKNIKRYCPAKDNRNSGKYSVFRVCQRCMQKHFPSCGKGSLFATANWAIMLANQHSLAFLTEVLGNGPDDYFLHKMDACERFSSLFPNFDRHRADGAGHPKSPEYQAPLALQKYAIEGRCRIMVSTPDGEQDLESLVEDNWVRFTNGDDRNAQVPLETEVGDDSDSGKVWIRLEQVQARVDCMCEILSHMKIDDDNPDLFTIVLEQKMGPDSPAAKVRSEDLSMICQRQRAALNRLPRICIRSIGDLGKYYCEVREGLMNDLLSQVHSGHNILISGGPGWGKSSTLYMLYNILADDTTSPVPLIIDTQRLRSASQGDDRKVTIPLFTGGETTIDEGEQVILLIDSVDEYFTSDATGFIRYLNMLCFHQLVVAGRQTISDNISDLFPFWRIVVSGSPDEYRDRMVEAYSAKNIKSLKEILRRYAIDNPMIIALACSYDGPIDAMDEWSLFKKAFRRMILVRMVTIRADQYEVNLDDVLSIMCEYAWICYHEPLIPQNVSQMISKSVGLNQDLVIRAIASLTESNGKFIHEAIGEYLVSEWVFRQASNMALRYDFLDKMLGTEIQRMIGSRISHDEALSNQLIRWYEKMIDLANVSERSELKTAIVMCYLARILIASGDSGNASRKVYAKFDALFDSLIHSPETPLMMVVCDTLIQTGRMDVESEYVRLLRENNCFARIVRLAYLSYAGDLEITNIGSSYCDMLWLDVRNSIKLMLRVISSDDLRYRYLCRSDIVIVDQILEAGYHADKAVLEKVANLNAEEVAKHIFDSVDFRTKLKTFDIKDACFFDDVVLSVNHLRSTAIARVAEFERERSKSAPRR